MPTVQFEWKFDAAGRATDVSLPPGSYKGLVDEAIRRLNRMIGILKDKKANLPLRPPSQIGDTE